MSGVTGKPRQTRLHALVFVLKRRKNWPECGDIVDTLTTISTLQRVKETLLTDEAQAHLYGHFADAARAFKINPMSWKKYRKGQITIRQAFSSIARLINDEWWITQFKAQCVRWLEALLITVGEVNKDRFHTRV